MPVLPVAVELGVAVAVGLLMIRVGVKVTVEVGGGMVAVGVKVGGPGVKVAVAGGVTCNNSF